MEKHFEYTTLAQRYTARFPLLTYVGTQVNFWVLVNLLLAAVLSLHARLIGQTLNLPVAGPVGPSLVMAAGLGLLSGVALGVTGYYLDRRVFRTVSLGRELLAKALGSLLLIALVQFILVHSAISPSLLLPGMALNRQAAHYLFGLLLLYYGFMTLMISFSPLCAARDQRQEWQSRADCRVQQAAQASLRHYQIAGALFSGFFAGNSHGHS